MYTLNTSYFWDTDLSDNTIVLTKNPNASVTDNVIKLLPDEIRVRPENMITLTVSDLPHPGKGIATTAGTAAIGTILLGPVGMIMGAAAGAMTSNKENQKEKKVYFQFQRDNDNNIYDYTGTIPTDWAYVLDDIRNSPAFGKNSSVSGNIGQTISGASNININPSDPTPTIDRIKLFLEDNAWSNALQYCNAALDLFPTNSYFYILQYCAKNKISKVESLNHEEHGKLYKDDDFQKALRFSSDAQDDAKAIYESSLKCAYDDIVKHESQMKSSNDYNQMIASMALIPDYKPAKDKIEEYTDCAARALISEQKSEYRMTKGSVNPNNHKSLMEAIDKFERQSSVVKKNRSSIRKYVEEGKGDAADLVFDKTIETTIQETKKQLYELACIFRNDDTSESLAKAAEIFEYLGFHEDSRQRLEEIKSIQKTMELDEIYQQAEEAKNAKDYHQATTLYKSLGNYKDAEQKIKDVEDAKLEDKYNEAIRRFNAGNSKGSKTIFKALGDYKDSNKYLTEIDSVAKKKTKKIIAIAAVVVIAFAGAGLGFHLHNVKKAEEAFIVSQEKTDELKPAVEKALANTTTSISAGSYFTVGLKSDGTVVSTHVLDDGLFKGQMNVKKWTDIIAVSAGDYHTVGLKSNGTVVAALIDDEYDYGQIDVSDWTDIVAISAGNKTTIGLKTDGTVAFAGYTKEEEKELSRWKNIVAISAGVFCTVGLKTDGTVVAVGMYEGKVFDASGWNWSDIVAVSAGAYHVVGLKSDGTVVAVPIDDEVDDGETDVSDWTDIIAISAGSGTMGLKSDGTVVVTGPFWGSERSEGDWTNIVAISAGGSDRTGYTVGLKSDGTVVATDITGDLGQYGQSDVDDWNGIVNKGYKYLSR